MEGAPVIGMVFINIAPGVSDDVRDRYMNWRYEIYAPLTLRVPGTIRFEQYHRARESLEYPQIGTISHYENYEAWQQALKSQEENAVKNEAAAWEKRGVREGIWATSYTLEKGFRSETALPVNNRGTTIDNAPFLHLEAYRLSAGEGEKYVKWLSDFGYGFIPLFTGLPGFKGYDFFKNTGNSGWYEARETDYPLYLSIMYFDNAETYRDYLKSREFVIYQKALRQVFPRGLNYRWDAEYYSTRTLKKENGN